ncbi:MAG: alpha/beta fold hydrolase [Solirubrobacterales bacterium]
MRRGWKILIGVVVVLAALLAINTVIVDNQTKEAEVTIEGGQILSLPGGDVQVVEEGPELRSRPGAPIVLLHCYSCSLHWFDELAPMLARRHRVIRIDLLGHGGSQKPSSGYEIEEQAALVAGALDELGVDGAVVVGHSMGFSVAVALATQASQLVDRVVNIGEGPTDDSCSVPFGARLGYTPVLGQAMWRLTPSFAIEDGYGEAFAPDYDLAEGFPNSDQVVDDFRAMTYTSFDEAEDATGDYVGAISLDDRMRQTAVPLLSIFGAEDRICEPEESQAAYAAVPGARVAEIEGAGHSPNVERPQETAALVQEFAIDAGDEAIRPPKDVGQRRQGERSQPERTRQDRPNQGE